MLYLVSGASRSGKTIVAKNILKQKQIPYMSLDWLVMGFTNGMPDVGIHDRLFPDKIAEKIQDFLKALCECLLAADIDYVIEGEAMLPEPIRQLLDAHPDKIRICFLGYTEIDADAKLREIKTYSDGTDDWLVKESDDYIHDHIINMVTHSRMIKTGCGKQDLCYIDTSADFMGAVAEAMNYLFPEIET